MRNLLAAVGSDDEDEDFGALFSQLARWWISCVYVDLKSQESIIIIIIIIMFAVCENNLQICSRRTERPMLRRFQIFNISFLYSFKPQVALAFYKAIGGGSDDEEGPI